MAETTAVPLFILEKWSLEYRHFFHAPIFIIITLRWDINYMVCEFNLRFVRYLLNSKLGDVDDHPHMVSEGQWWGARCQGFVNEMAKIKK